MKPKKTQKNYKVIIDEDKLIVSKVSCNFSPILMETDCYHINYLSVRIFLWAKYKIPLAFIM